MRGAAENVMHLRASNDPTAVLVNGVSRCSCSLLSVLSAIVKLVVMSIVGLVVLLIHYFPNIVVTTTTTTITTMPHDYCHYCNYYGMWCIYFAVGTREQIRISASTVLMSPVQHLNKLLI